MKLTPILTAFAPAFSASAAQVVADGDTPSTSLDWADVTACWENFKLIKVEGSGHPQPL